MSSYSEKELLMLSNFVYLNPSTQDKCISDILAQYKAEDGSFTQESVRSAGTGGGLDSKQVSELFTMMQKECDKKGSDFGNLIPVRRLEEKDVRAVMYTNQKDEKPVVVFRGTGGTKEAWTDNLHGGFKTDTRIQKVASDFVKYECGAYTNITVTGHSKGGNLSQYVTVMNDEKIASCVSFDGQGMNADFIGQNIDKVSKSAGKIKSISAYNDFVNILLTSIAGTVVYAKNTEKGVNAHSSFYLLKSNEYDQDGNIISLTNQSPIEGSMKKVTDKIAKAIGGGEEIDNMLLGGILGEAIASMVMAESKEDVYESLSGAATEAMLAFSVKLDSLFSDMDMEIASLPSGGVYFDHGGVKTVADGMFDSQNETRLLMERTGDVIMNLDMNIASRFYADLALNTMTEKLNNMNLMLGKMGDALMLSCDMYMRQESMTAHRMQSPEFQRTS